MKETRFTSVFIMITAWQGRIVEDAPLAQLLAQASRYRALLEAERSVQEDLWADDQWRRLWLEDGELKEVRVTG